MLPETRINSKLIDCWSLLLNTIESEENEVPRMVFFGIHQMDSGMKINLHADLIFIPLHIDYHYACICINFVSQTVDVLDQMTYPDWKESDVYKASCVLVSLFPTLRF
ncbi:hypothetical protein RND81_10G069100 [Saponaria officinalis]|uniref:Ubiquitin-like protease family profile domain-containing protein n=1 Tax=Saponaria officinalis TaxID=3572 RepID=A0AAW1HYH8_SAPOF